VVTYKIIKDSPDSEQRLIRKTFDADIDFTIAELKEQIRELEAEINVLTTKKEELLNEIEEVRKLI